MFEYLVYGPQHVLVLGLQFKLLKKKEGNRPEEFFIVAFRPFLDMNHDFFFLQTEAKV